MYFYLLTWFWWWKSNILTKAEAMICQNPATQLIIKAPHNKSTLFIMWGAFFMDITVTLSFQLSMIFGYYYIKNCPIGHFYVSSAVTVKIENLIFFSLF